MFQHQLLGDVELLRMGQDVPRVLERACALLFAAVDGYRGSDRTDDGLGALRPMGIFVGAHFADDQRLGQVAAFVQGLIVGCHEVERVKGIGTAFEFFHWVTTLKGSRMTILCPMRRRRSAVSRAFSPLKSTTTQLSSQVNKKGMMQETPLPTPVGAKTAVWTTCGRRTTWPCLRVRHLRLLKNSRQASLAGSLRLKSALMAWPSGVPSLGTRPRISPFLAPIIPAPCNSAVLAQAAVPKAVNSRRPFLRAATMMLTIRMAHASP